MAWRQEIIEYIVILVVEGIFTLGYFSPFGIVSSDSFLRLALTPVRVAIEFYALKLALAESLILLSSRRRAGGVNS